MQFKDGEAIIFMEPWKTPIKLTSARVLVKNNYSMWSNVYYNIRGPDGVESVIRTPNILGYDCDKESSIS